MVRRVSSSPSGKISCSREAVVKVPFTTSSTFSVIEGWSSGALMRDPRTVI
jgi:hypothetical protein